MTASQHKIYWPYIIGAYLSLFSLGFLDNFRSPFFFDIIRDLDLSDSVSSLYFIVPSIFGYVGGQLCNFNIHRIQPLWGLRMGLISLALGIVSLSQMESLWGMMIPSLIFGLGLGILGVYEHACVYQGSSPAQRRRLLAGLHTIYAGSALCAPLLVKFIADSLGWDWRTSFLCAAGVPVTMLLIVSFLKKPKDPVASEEKVVARRAPKSFFMNFTFTSLMSALYVSSEIIISTRLPLYLRRNYDFSLPDSSQYLFYFFVLMFLGRAFFIVFPLKTFKTKNLIIVSLSLSLLSFGFGLWLNPLGIVFCGLFMSPCFALFIEYITEVFTEYAEHAMGYAMVMATLMTIPMHYFVGLLTESFGLKVALHLGPVFLLLSLIMLLTRDRIFKT